MFEPVKRGAHHFLLLGLRLHHVAHQLLLGAHVLDKALNAFGQVRHGGDGPLVGAAAVARQFQPLADHAQLFGCLARHAL